MNNQELRACLEALPSLSAWPELLDLFPSTPAPLRTDWALPAYALRAAGQLQERALPVAAALAALQISIMLVDDILDEDPRGKHMEMGSGRAANLALALQAAAHLVLDQLEADVARRYEVAACLQTMALATAAGQELDTQPISGEAAYWRLVTAKSTPFYGAALEAGAILAGVSQATCQAIRTIGVHFGEIIQVMDDLDDAFQIPAKPDWQRQNNNLAILYAKSADHSQRDRFLDLLDEIDAPGHLHAVQQILIDCGAVSYCLYQILQRYRSSLTLLYASDLPDHQPILDLHHLQMRPLAGLLRSIGVSLPPELQDL